MDTDDTIQIIMCTHLYTRSCYSLLESLIRPVDLVKRSKELGYSSIALTDHNVMFATPVFAHACRKEGIHPIFGLEAEIHYHDALVPFLLLAKDNIGYTEIMHLSTLLNDQRTVCDEKVLIQHSTHCFLIAYGEGGWMDSELVHDDAKGVRKKLQIMQEELPVFDVALSYMDSSMWKLKNRMLKEICRSMKIRTVALNKIYYLRPQDAEAYRVEQAVKLGRTLNDASVSVVTGRFLLSREEMKSLYEEDDLKRTDEIASQCTADGNIEKSSLPSFPVPSSVTSAQYLTQLCLAGLKKRLNGKTDERYLRRLHHELEVICSMHFEDYFLIVWDYIRFARKKGIMVGPGRGSAAGSLCAYCLGITQIDPIHYDLLFERFLNPERVTMPDIDTDFPDNRREEVIQYVKDQYGLDYTCNIIAFGTFGARQAVRDAGKVMNLPSRDIEALMRLIPANAETIASALDSSARLREVVGGERRYQRLLQTASLLEGLPRHYTIHPAGVVISRKKVCDVVPMIRFEDGLMTSQFDKDYLEERGLIKMDFLSLKNLTTIDEIVKKIQQKEPSFNILKIPLDDPETIAVFHRGDTAGVFQFESSGMIRVLNQIRPDSFDDITAALALFRPGPKDNIPQYVKNKQNPAGIHYPAKALIPVLKSTYGIMIYQEQIMLTAEIIAGFTPGQADNLRKGMSKKDPGVIENLKQDFIRGAGRNGYDAKTARQLYGYIEKFAGYGFNKSHAVCYTLVSYQTAYLKAHWPQYFYASLLDSVIGDEQKTAAYLDECRRKGVEIEKPDVNRSTLQYQSSEKKILLPLTVIKGLGVNAAGALIKEREKKPFSSFFDFTARCSLIPISRNLIAVMIDAGTLDCFGETRTTLKAALDDAMNYSDLVRIEKNGQMGIDPDLVSEPTMIRRKDISYEISENERNALGFTLGKHPVIEARKRLNVHLPSLISLLETNGNVHGFAQIDSIHTHKTKKGQMMCFLEVSDETAVLKCTVWPDAYARSAGTLARGALVDFHGKMNQERECLVDEIHAVKMPDGSGRK